MKRFFEWLGAQWREFADLDAAWEKITSLETQVHLLWTHHEAGERRSAQIAASLLDLKTQIEDLRRIVTARKAEEPTPPRIARTWREVQNFMGDSTDAPAS